MVVGLVAWFNDVGVGLFGFVRRYKRWDVVVDVRDKVIGRDIRFRKVEVMVGSLMEGRGFHVWGIK